ncbi:MAG: DUF4412 domain-containing protein [Bacteroidetes bacterium]|nr:DUF4412 domain-containing protein [Bacteroidota bacterium]MCL1968851.1 DUF4412 domain-containing protein [Bacteroidota bacterium]
MKKITLLLLSIFILATYSIQAQKQFAGEIQFKTKIEGTDDPNLTSSIENLTLTVVILGNKSKVIQNMEGMYSMTMVWDGDKESSFFVVEVTGMGKFYKKTTAEEHKEKMKFQDQKYNYVNEFKDICGYKCQKVIATTTNLEDDSTQETIFYVTKEIGSAKLNWNEHPGLEGYPLMTLTPLPQFCDECMMAMEAIKITPKKIKDVDFLLPDDAKNIDDDPELKQMFGIE